MCFPPKTGVQRALGVDIYTFLPPFSWFFEAFRACEDSVQNISCVDFEVYVGANVDSDTKLIQYEGMDLKACRAEGFEVPSRGLYT